MSTSSSTAPHPSRHPPRGEWMAWIERVAHGDRDALASLYDAASPYVMACARRLVHDVQLAEEVTLNVFLQVWKSAATFDATRGGPEVWLMTIARSRSLDAIRARHRRTTVTTTELPAAEPADARPLPSDVALDDDELKQLALALAELPEPQRMAIQLSVKAGLTHREIALRLDVPVGTVKTRIRLGMAKLRAQLVGEEEA